jgi:hypothetical protein
MTQARVEGAKETNFILALARKTNKQALLRYSLTALAVKPGKNSFNKKLKHFSRHGLRRAIGARSKQAKAGAPWAWGSMGREARQPQLLLRHS